MSTTSEMNIFALHDSPFQSAREMCDKHVVKMPVETAQMLSTVHRMLDGKPYVDYSKNARAYPAMVASD